MINEQLLRQFDKNVVITGGTGMIGRQIAKILVDAGANVRVVSLDDIVIHKNIDHVKGDLTSFDFCKSITSDMDYVFHVAGIKGSVQVTLEKTCQLFCSSIDVQHQCIGSEQTE